MSELRGTSGGIVDGGEGEGSLVGRVEVLEQWSLEDWDGRGFGGVTWRDGDIFN